MAVIGANGSGKSTLLKAILSFYPVIGEIKFAGKQIKTLSSLNRARIIAYLSQDTMMSFNLLAKEVIELGIYPYRNVFSKKKKLQAIDEVMHLTEVYQLKNQEYFSLSGGEKQRVQLARVLLQLNLFDDNQAKLLLLDEHVNHLDLSHQHSMLALINRFTKMYNLTVVMVLHDLNLVMRYADQVAVIDKGELYNLGKSQDVIDEKMIKAIYNMKFLHFPELNQGLIFP
ncbi:ABC transporter ATP-binding protein [Thiotrichales bacterium 19S3-7]|nr:ABC transporter ATP-binding protein [Thiotrichales bacterium 19S3-7]MCF6801383.1 ABC transporter ATP-binding protein [Thiotrichales bacterium 19S3-11]